MINDKKYLRVNLLKLFTFVVLVLALTSGLVAAVPTLSHTPPLQLNTNKPTPVRLTITGERDALESASLFYREAGKPTYQDITFRRGEINSNNITFNLPQVDRMSAGYEYYFSVTVQGKQLTYPEHSPSTSPLRLRVGGGASLSRNINLLNTDTNVSSGQDLVFAVSLYAMASDVKEESIRVLMNGSDITKATKISLPLVVYTRTNPTAGNYTFQVRATMKNGQTIESPVWQFSVGGKKSFFDNLPFNVRGNAIFTSNVRSLTDSDSTQYAGSQINDASLRFNLMAREKWFSFATNLYLSSYESSKKQSLNRYRFELSAPFIDLYLVDSTPNYGAFLLSGHNVRGVSGRLYSGGLSLYATQGHTLRALDGKISAEGEDNEGGTFQRNLLAAKLELGEDDGLKVGFGFAKTKDDIDSIEEEYHFSISQSDSTRTILTAPQDNLVLGTDVQLSFNNRQLVAGLELAGSLYNSDITDGSLTKEELEEYLGEEMPIDPSKFDKYITINPNLQPFKPGRAMVAWQIYTRWYFSSPQVSNMLNFTYSEIGASFRSLGASSVQNDASILSVSDYITLFKNRLTIDGGISIMEDNLSETKMTTTTNTSWYAQSMIRPRNDLPYFRMGANFINTSNDADTMNVFEPKLDQDMDSYNFGVGYRIEQIPFTVTTVDFSYSLSNDKDLTESKSFDLKRDSYNFNILNTLRDIPLSTRFSYCNSSQEDATAEDKNKSDCSSIGFKNEYSLFNGMLTPYLDISVNKFGENKNSLTRYDIGTEIIPLSKTTITTRVELTDFTNKDTTDGDYSLFGWYLNINQRF